jgi:hypothetical protein
VDLLGDRTDPLLREAPEGVLHHREVVVEVARPLGPAELGEELRGAIGACKGECGIESPLFGAPLPLATHEPGGDVMDCVCDEGACDAGLLVAVLSVVEDGPSVLDRRCGVREVVGDDLVRVDVAVGGEAPEGALDNRAGGLDRRCGCGEVGGRYRHGGGGIGLLRHVGDRRSCDTLEISTKFRGKDSNPLFLDQNQTC